MNQQYQPIDNYGVTGTSVEARNRVLRNTYWLLALSLIPTVLGAVIGGQMGMLQVFAKMSVWLRLGIFFGGAFGLMFAVEKTKETSLGIVFLLLFTFFIGFMLSPMLTFVLYRYGNGAQLIATAFAGTAGVFFIMATLSTIIKRDISSWGKFLSIGIMMAVAAGVLNILWGQSSTFAIVISTLVIGISSAFLLYKLKSIVDGGETNYISATLSIYVSLYNIFVSLLHLLSVLAGED